MAIDIHQVTSLWKKFSSFPGGKKAFSKIIGFSVPYTGTLGATVVELSRGHVAVELRDRRKVRNHLNSIHAMALANIGEFATGLALQTALEAQQRAILVGFEIQYMKKARGTLRAICDFELSRKDVKQSFDESVSANIFNAENQVVARVSAKWKVGPASKPSTKS